MKNNIILYIFSLLLKKPLVLLLVLCFCSFKSPSLFATNSVENNSLSCITTGPDKDGDGVPDDRDFDIDNDGIPNNQEVSNCITPSLRWLHNDNGGQSDFATYTDPSHSAYYSNTSNITFGNGLDETSDNFVYTYLLRGADQSNYLTAKADNDYAELSFTPSIDQLLYGINFGFYTNNSFAPDFNAGNFKIAIESSNDNFASSTLLLQDVQVGNMIAGNYLLIENSLAGLDLLAGSQYDFRFYLYDEQNSDFFSRVRIDDIFFNTVIKDSCVDVDGDGIENYFDLDSDNDGIPDAIEACGNTALTLEDCTLDSNGDAVYEMDPITGCSTGILSNNGCDPLSDTDGDGTPDFLDLDSDGDGCSDALEAGTDGFGTSNIIGTYVAGSVDAYGLLTTGISGSCLIPTTADWITIDPCFSLCSGSDKDGDGVPDDRDFDIDNDGIPNDQELANCLTSSIRWTHNELIVRDEAGRVIKVVKQDGKAGDNAIPLIELDIAPGFIHYQLVTKFGTKSKKMIRVE